MASVKIAFVIDDSESYQKILQAHLNQLGFIVISFFNVQDCLNHHERRPDVILLDQNLGNGVMGIDFLQTLRSKMPSVPIVFLSADGNLNIATQAIKRGAFDYIEKDGAAFVRLRTALDSIFASLEKQAKWKERIRWMVLALGITLVTILGISQFS